MFAEHVPAFERFAAAGPRTPARDDALGRVTRHERLRREGIGLTKLARRFMISTVRVRQILRQRASRRASTDRQRVLPAPVGAVASGSETAGRWAGVGGSASRSGRCPLNRSPMVKKVTPKVNSVRQQLDKLTEGHPVGRSGRSLQ